jgi:hypothetical protein
MQVGAGHGPADLDLSRIVPVYKSAPRFKERGPIVDTVLSFLISAGIIAFGVWVVAGTITAGWPLAWTIMGLLAILVGMLSLYGSVRDTRTP